MSGLRLPPALVDLVFSRAYPQNLHASRYVVSVPVPRHLSKRFAQSAALLRPRLDTVVAEQQPFRDYAYTTRKQDQKVSLFNMPSHRSTPTQLEEHVLKLKQLAGTDPIALSYTEEDLLAVYEDLLAPHPDQTLHVQHQPTVDESHASAVGLVTEASRRLCQAELDGPRLPYRVLIEELQAMASSLESVGASVGLQDVGQVPLALVTVKEWEALVQCAMHEEDFVSAEQVLGLMKRFGSERSEDCLNIVLGSCASNGDIAHYEQFMKNYVAETPSDRQRDLHVKAYIKSIPQTAFPTDALRVLHAYEARALPAPQQTYTRLISHLFSANSSVAHAHAWDLYSHMRYVAHPKPDIVTYTMMLRACASSALSGSGEPERALDLFTEMTVERRIQPTTGAYTAVILACARSGKTHYVHEAFRLAKEMLDSYRDARGMSALALDRRFFCALLEGAKRIGDLGRVRWILAEVVKATLGAGMGGGQGVLVSEDAVVQEDVMVHVFHAYAAYNPPFKRGMTVVAEQMKGPVDASQAVPENTAVDQERAEDLDLTTQRQISFGQLPPQTHAEVVQEAETLFTRIIEDRSAADNEGVDNGSLQPVFQRVQLTSKLLNAYLSIHYAHSSFDRWRELFGTLHAQHGIPRDTWTYVDVLERCARTKKGPERLLALQLAEEAWQEWSALEHAWRSCDGSAAATRVTPRLVERVHGAMIRMLAITGNLDKALARVTAFQHAYPPSAVRSAPPKHPARSTRTSLADGGARPLVRLFTDVDVPDDGVPPLLTFAELEVLHHRLVAASGRERDIKYLGWVCRSYEGALRARRDAAMRARPAADVHAERNVRDSTE